ncbi:MAG: hypothetical protein NDI81_21240 [Desulfobacula sp.]|nr:hypothetical protein [Desulfobacula sp.]
MINGFIREHLDYKEQSSVTDPLGRVTLYGYDTLTRTHAVTTTKPATGSFNHITQYPDLDYRYAKPLTFRNENSHETAYEYYVFGRVTRILYPDGGEETYAYTDAALPRSVTKGKRDGTDSFIYTITYLDGFGRTIETAEPSMGSTFAVTLFTFDNMGRAACTRGPLIKTGNDFLSADFASISATPANVGSGTPTTWTRNYYDTRSRLICMQRSGEETTWFAHELLKTVTTDPDGNTKTRISDLLGRPVEIIEHGLTDHSTTYAYSPAGDLLSVSRINPATGNPVVNTVTYDTLGQKLTLQDPDMGAWSYAYDLAGRLASKAVTKDNVAFKTLNYAFYPGTSLLKRVSDGNNNTLSEISLYSPQGKMEAVSFNGGKTVTTYSYIQETGRLI